MRFNMKKIVGLGLAITMAVGMSVSTMAASPNNNNRYPIEVDIDVNYNGQIDAGEVYNIELNADGSGVLVNADQTTTAFSKYAQPGTHTIENSTVATAFDAIYGTGLVQNITGQPQQFYEVEYKDPVTWAGTGNYGIAFDTVAGHKGTETENGDGSTHYEFWELYIQDDNATSPSSAANYATHYLASNISKVVVLMSSFDY